MTTSIRRQRPARIVLIRHGQTSWSASGRHTGRTDLSLDEIGEKAASSLGQRLALEQITQCYASPLSRACRTAELAGFSKPQLLSDLQEWDYGDYEGKTTVEIQKERPDWSLWRDGCPGGENAAEVARRADRAIATIVGGASENDVVAVFSHGHLLRILGVRWLGLAPQEGRLFVLHTARLCALGFEHDERVLRSWNS